jgi:hypothetical protein
VLIFSRGIIWLEFKKIKFSIYNYTKRGVFRGLSSNKNCCKEVTLGRKITQLIKSGQFIQAHFTCLKNTPERSATTLKYNLQDTPLPLQNKPLLVKQQAKATGQ